jgi:hypothetical protein
MLKKEVFIMRISHLDLIVQPDIAGEELSCEGTFTISDPKEEIFFHLNNTLTISELFVIDDGLESKVTIEESAIAEDFFIKAAKRIKVVLPNDYSDKEKLRFRISYRGPIQTDQPYKTNYFTSQAIELAIYVAWYPIIQLDDNPSFKVRLIGPTDWTWIMNAERQKELENNEQKEILWKRNDGGTDLTLHGRPQKTAISDQQSQIFWGDKQYYKDFQKLENDILEYRKKLEVWLGEPIVTSFVIAITSRETGGTYVRQGLISTQGKLEQKYYTTLKQRFLRGWMHEIAHLWFIASEKSTYHNWLDEALAEYSSLLLSEHFYGPNFVEQYKARVREVITKEDELPAIQEITRAHKQSMKVFYYWGSLIIDKIRQEMGRESFLEAMKVFVQKSREKKKVVTQDLIDSLNSVDKTDWTDFIEKMIALQPDITALE